jgi:hypothetical protein
MLALFTYGGATVVVVPIARAWLVRCRQASAPLTATGLLMLALLPIFVAGLLLDPRLVTGAPVWFKPAKFAASIAIYTLTLAWVFTWLPEWVRTRKAVGWITAGVLVVEMGIITTQAARGVASHFNVGTPLDGALFGIMGAAIVVQTLASVAVAAALWRQAFADRAMAWAFRLGFTLAIVGASTGGLMAQPTAAQRASLADGPPAVVGAHTVGAPDGGPGLPGTGWSTGHGDLRVAHFVGLHAFQALPLLALLLPAGWTDGRRARVVCVGAVSYAGLFGILLWQALGGESVAVPAPATLAALSLWAAASVSAAWLAATSRRAAPRWDRRAARAAPGRALRASR